MSETVWVYKQTETAAEQGYKGPGLWTVGYYDPSGQWEPESDHGSPEAAAERVHYLNGGCVVNRVLDEALNSGDGVYRP